MGSFLLSPHQHSSELLLDSLLAPSVHSPHDSGPVPADCGGTQPGGDLGLVGDYLGVSPSHSDGYMTGQPSPFSESSLSEGTVSTVGYSPSNLLSDENLQTMLDQSATANHSGNFPMSGTTATRGETTSSPTLAELGSFEEYNFITTQSHELDLGVYSPLSSLCTPTLSALHPHSLCSAPPLSLLCTPTLFALLPFSLCSAPPLSLLCTPTPFALLPFSLCSAPPLSLLCTPTPFALHPHSLCSAPPLFFLSTPLSLSANGLGSLAHCVFCWSFRFAGNGELPQVNPSSL